MKNSEIWKRSLYCLDAAIRDFDFIRVHNIMSILEWKWSVNDKLESSLKVPTILHMKKTVRELGRSAIEKMIEHKEDEYTVSAGGFVVTVHGPTSHDNFFFANICFVLCESNHHELWDEHLQIENGI
jgi:hypothetical protein